MTDRLNPEALRTVADVILRHCGGYVDTTPADAERAAKAVLRNLAALPAPRTITTVEELEALPVGAIVLDGDLSGPVQMVEKSQIVGAEWAVLAVGVTYTSSYITLPARVLWVPTEGGRE